MNLAELTARISRLDRLAQRLARQVTFGGEGEDPLEYHEERTHLNAILDALAAVESARTTLDRARQRLENEQRPKQRGYDRA
jgi:hypothetical protein